VFQEPEIMRSDVAYMRVSTTGQGKSGLRLEAQGEAIARFAAQEGFHIAHSFAEIETGKGADALDRRPKLTAAHKAARKIDKARPVIVAKLDRLSRDVHFISGLMQRRTPFMVRNSALIPTRSCCTFMPRLPKKSAG
jgi:DNA invertase Pin-like site-specific DNA recombinase